MRKLTILFVLFSVFAFSQKRKKGLDVVSNIDVKVLAMKPIGNNSLAENLQPFYGFGFGGNLMTPINFGLGLDYSEFFSNVQNDKLTLYGILDYSRMTVIYALLTLR